MRQLVVDLGRAGLGAEAAAVGEALARVDPGLRSMLDGHVAVSLARAGMADHALAQVAENPTPWPHDVSIRMDAGEARAAVNLTEEVDDFEARAEAFERLRGTRSTAGAAGRRRRAEGDDAWHTSRPRVMRTYPTGGLYGMARGRCRCGPVGCAWLPANGGTTWLRMPA